MLCNQVFNPAINLAQVIKHNIFLNLFSFILVMRSKDGFATGAGDGLPKSLQGLPGTGRKEEWVGGGTCSSSASPF
jgi:hypothetical protein